MRHVSYAEALEAAVFEEMQRDSKVYYMGEDVGVFGGAITKMYSLFKTFPDRVMDMPLDEKGFTGVAVGMAWMGLRPIVEMMYPDFIVLAMNEIAHGACKEYWLSNQKVPVPVVIRSAQGIGSQCGAHHSECIEGWMMNYPGLKIAVPTFPEDAYGMMKHAIRDNDPVLWLDCRTTCYTEHADIPEADEDAVITFGQARIRREGTDVTIVAWHKLLKDALAAAEDLEKQGISCEVIDPRTLIPFDIDTVLASIRKTGHLVIAHEANIRGGFGAEIAAQVTEREAGALKAPIVRVGTPNTYIPVGMVEWEIVPDKMDVIRAVKKTLGRELLEEEKGQVEVDGVAELKKSRPKTDVD